MVLVFEGIRPGKSLKDLEFDVNYRVGTLKAYRSNTFFNAVPMCSTSHMEYVIHCLCLFVFPGDRVYNSGQGTGAPQALSQGSVRYDAGLLAEGATTAPQH